MLRKTLYMLQPLDVGTAGAGRPLTLLKRSKNTTATRPATAKPTRMIFKLRDVPNYLDTPGTALPDALPRGFDGKIFGMIFLFMSWLFGVHKPRKIAELFVALLTLAAVGIFSGGTVARPIYFPAVLLDTSWKDLWLRAAEVIGPDSNLSFVPVQYQLGLAVLVAVSTVALLLIVVRSRNDEAVAMILGVAILAAMLAITGKRWEFQQSLTIYVPATLCAVGALLVHSRSFWYEAAAALAAIIIAAGMGRFAATINYTVGAGTNPRFWVGKSETDAILTTAGSNGGAYIDTPDVYSTYPLVLEMHRAGIDYQLSPRAWKSFLGYRR
jgi:hypothetical protein